MTSQLDNRRYTEREAALRRLRLVWGLYGGPATSRAGELDDPDLSQIIDAVDKLVRADDALRADLYADIERRIEAIRAND